jgi:hypothetical protein
MDSKNQDFGLNSKYPAEYAHIEERVQSALEKIRQFDEQIKTMPNDRGPDLSYNPPSFLKSRQLGSRDQYISSLEKAKAHVKTETWQEIQQLLKEDNTPDAKQIRDLAREDIYPNTYKSMESAERQDHQGQSKDVEQSQDYMDATLESYRNRIKTKELDIIPEKNPDIEQGRDIDKSQELMTNLIEDYQQRDNSKKEDIEQSELPKEEGQSISISQRFSQSLSYSKALNQEDKGITPSIDKDSPDRD